MKVFFIDITKVTSKR